MKSVFKTGMAAALAGAAALCATQPANAQGLRGALGNLAREMVEQDAQPAPQPQPQPRPPQQTPPDRYRPPPPWPDRDYRDWDRPGYDAYRFPRDSWAPYRFEWHGPAYRNPPGVTVRAWSYGSVLPRAWYPATAVIHDWWRYRLPEPPFPLDWVRLGQDAVLIDRLDGRVHHVVRNLFW